MGVVVCEDDGEKEGEYVWADGGGEGALEGAELGFCCREGVWAGDDGETRAADEGGLGLGGVPGNFDFFWSGSYTQEGVAVLVAGGFHSDELFDDGAGGHA